MLNDLRLAFRLFGRAPGFAAAAVVSIGLAIGSNAAIFSLADALFMRPLDVPDPSRLVTLGTRPWQDDGRHSLPDYADFSAANRSFASLAAVRTVRAGISREAGTSTDLRVGFAVTSNFLATFGVPPEAGRDFRAAEGQVAGRDAVVLLGHDYWVRELDQDPSIVGRTVRLNGRPFDVIGIVPDAFAHLFDLARPAFFVPVTMAPFLDGDAGDAQLTDRGQRLFTVKGRLQPGVSVEAANDEAAAIFRRLAAAHPESNRRIDGIVLSELRSRVAGDPYTPILLGFLGTLTFVLLCIACGNVANLTLGRASARTREIGVRLAIGAGRGRLVRMLLTESLVLALAGGLAGAGFAAGGIALLRAFAPSSGLDVPTPLLIELDARTMLVTFAIAGASALLFGLAPALRAGRTDVLTALKPGAGESGRARMVGRSALVVVQIAGSLVLLVAATQIARGLSYALDSDPGFSTDRRLTMRLDPRLAGYSPLRSEQFYRELTARAAAVPGVRSVALATSLPTVSRFDAIAVAPEGFTFPPGQSSATIASASVDASYFDTLGVRLVRGRTFRTTDRADGPWVAVVDESFAVRYLGPNPLGQRLRLVELGGRTAEVVGISAAARPSAIIMPPQPFLFLPLAQHPSSRLTLDRAHRRRRGGHGRCPARGGAIDRRGRARVSRGDHAGAVRRTVEETGHPVDRHFHLRRPGGPDDGAHRPVRHRGVSGEPAHAGDRHPHGARRAPRAGAAPRPSPGGRDGRGRCVGGNRRQLCGRPRHDRGARRAVVRPGAVHAGANRTARDDAPRRRTPRATRGLDRSAAGAATGLVAVR